MDVLVPGARAGPWRVEAELGRGGMGVVYAVVHHKIGKRAALKVMHRRLSEIAGNSDINFEARIANRVDHHNIVDIFEAGVLRDGRPYIVMERLIGLSLHALAQLGKLSPERVIAILLQMCDGLHAAHTAGVVHRDLKPENVFIVPRTGEPDRPHVKLLDWGIAKVLSTGVRETISTEIIGTPNYLAPEQAFGEPVSAKTDIYALGVIAYELLLGHLPFEARTVAEVINMHIDSPPPDPTVDWPAIPPVLANLLAAMLAKTPAARPSVLEVTAGLESSRRELDAADQLVTLGLPSSPPRLIVPLPVHRRGRVVHWRLAVGLLAIASTAAMFSISRDDDSSVEARPLPPVIVRSPVVMRAATAPSPRPILLITPIIVPAPPPDVPRVSAPDVLPLPTPPAHRHPHNPRRAVPARVEPAQPAQIVSRAIAAAAPPVVRDDDMIAPYP